MPSAEIRNQLAEVLHSIAGVAPSDVRDTASLKDLGLDSLATVELAEGIERTFQVSPPEVDVAEWRTVGDVVRTVMRQQDVREAPANPSFIPTPQTLVDPDQSKAFKQLAVLLAVVGAGVGIGIGVLFAALLSSGLGGGSMPEKEPVALPSAATSLPAEQPEPSEPAPRRSTEPEASLKATPASVSAGQRFGLSGVLPDASPGEALEIQMRDGDAAWEKFPVTLSAGEGGSFKTELYTSRTGAHEFQVVSPGSKKATPSVTVTIG